MTTPSTIECPVCAGEARVLSSVTHRSTTGTLYRCQRCGHKTGKLNLGRDDPPETHAFIRRKLAGMLRPAPRPAAA